MNTMIAFLKEIRNRMAMKSPSFFRVIQWLSIITAAISGLPALINQFQSELHIVLPSWIIALSNKVVLYSAIVAWIIAKLPVADPTQTVLKNDGTTKPLLTFTNKK